MVAIMSLLGAALYDLVLLEDRLALASEGDRRAFYAAESGLYRAFLEASDGDGTLDFATLFAAAGTTTMFANQPFQGASYTVTAVKVTGSNPNRVTLTATGCYPASNPCPAGSTQAALQAQVVNSPSVTGFFGAQDIWFKSQAVIDSYDSREGPYNAATAGGAGEVAGNGAPSCQSCVSMKIEGSGSMVKATLRARTGSASIAAGSTVQGSVTAAGTITNSGTVTGGVFPNQPAPAETLQPVTACGPPYAAASSFSGSNFTYNASTGALTVNSGGSVTFPAGTYCFGTVTFNTASLVVQGPVVLNLTGTFNASSSAQINANGTPANLQVRTSFSGSQKGIWVKSSASAWMVGYAPATEARIEGASHFYGGIMAKMIQNDSAGLHYDVALRSASGLQVGTSGSAFAMDSWKLCQNPTCS